MEKHRLIPMNNLLHVGVINVNYYKSVHRPIPTRENREHPGNFKNKSVSYAFNWHLSFYFLKWNCHFSACKRKSLESTSQFSFIFCINVQCHETTPLYFFSSNIIYFGQKQRIKACVRYFSPFLKEQYVSWLFGTKFFEIKFNIQLLYLLNVSRAFILSWATTRCPPS